MTTHLRAAPSLLLAALLGCSSASSTARPPDEATTRYTKIDDMEGERNQIPWSPRPGVVPPGFWFSTTDCSQADRISPGPVTPQLNPWSYEPLETPHETLVPGVMSRHAARLRTTVPLVGVWGASMGVALAGNPPGDGAVTPPPDSGDGDTGGDASSGPPDGGPSTTDRPCKQGSSLDYPFTALSNINAYSGITFWAAVAPGSEARAIRVQLNDANTDPRGGICNADNPASDTNCYNGFGTSVALTERFARYTVDFASLLQRPSWGYPVSGPVDTEHVYNLNFEVDLPDCAATPETMCAGGPPSVWFDFTIDDLYFVNK
jgi:hypothetical protein